MLEHLTKVKIVLYNYQILISVDSTPGQPIQTTYQKFFKLPKP